MTSRFLDSNGLQLVIRSHEVMDEGYQVMHGGKLITVFRCVAACVACANAYPFAWRNYSVFSTLLPFPIPLPLYYCSAPRYCDSMDNKGAVVRLDRECKPSFLQFESVPHPPVRPMAYASGMSMYGL